MNEQLPAWFQVFTDGLFRELKEIRDSQIRLESKTDAIHDETRRTNGRVTSHDGRITVLEHARDEGTQERRSKRSVYVGPLIGAGGTGICLTLLEVLRALH